MNTIDQEIITIYCIIDDILKAINHQDDPQAKMSSSEIITTSIVACLFFGGNYRKALKFMELYCSYVISESRFNRRLKIISEKLGHVFYKLTQIFSLLPLDKVEEYAIDSFPVKVCKNIRANRCKIAPSKEFRGFIPSKRTYYHGVKIHIIGSNSGYIKEFYITPASVHDIRALYELPLNLEEGSTLYADKAYTDYEIEDLLKDIDSINLMPIRCKNSKRLNAVEQFIAKVNRRFIETIGSQLNVLFPKKIHAVKLEGFILKLNFFILSFNIQQLLKVAS